MYSTLSQSSEQAFLLLTYLPGMVRIFETQWATIQWKSCGQFVWKLLSHRRLCLLCYLNSIRMGRVIFSKCTTNGPSILAIVNQKYVKDWVPHINNFGFFWYLVGVYSFIFWGYYHSRLIGILSQWHWKLLSIHLPSSQLQIKGFFLIMFSSYWKFWITPPKCIGTSGCPRTDVLITPAGKRILIAQGTTSIQFISAEGSTICGLKLLKVGRKERGGSSFILFGGYNL